MQAQLNETIFDLLQDISKSAEEAGQSVYLIGGIVRDIILKQPNDDIDIVVEGNGITFAKKLYADYGGELVLHETFNTATWTSENVLEIDTTASRLEYYKRPAALPDVETSTLKEDLYRRDFTINAMAIYLNASIFGQLIDPFNGQLDLKEKKIEILHNLSFVEDPTRILRAIRFETRFNFSMDEQTEKLSLESIDQIKDLSVNRIVTELEKMLQETNPVQSLNRLFELKFFEQYGIKETYASKSMAHAKKLQNLYTKISPKTPVSSFDYFITPYYQLAKLLHAKQIPYTKISPKAQVSCFDHFIIPFYQAEKLVQVKQFALTKRDMKVLNELEHLKAMKNIEDVESVGEFHRIIKDYSDAALLIFIAKIELSNENMLIEYLNKRHVIPTLLTGKDLINEGLKPSNYFAELLFELDIEILNNKVNTKEEALLWLKQQID